MGGILTLEARTHSLKCGVNRRVILPPSSPPHSCANIFGDFVDDDDHDDLSSSSSFSFANTFIGLKKCLIKLKGHPGFKNFIGKRNCSANRTN